MLKIKDNVDLKELEKYGITKNEGGYSVNNVIGEIYCGIGEAIYIFGYSMNYMQSEDGLDEIYDLIKADLVEKVD